MLGPRKSILKSNDSHQIQSNAPEQERSLSANHTINILMPVQPGELSQYTFNWYLRYIHKPGYYINLCHVPELSFKIKAGMSNSEVLNIMQDIDFKMEELKRMYEQLLIDNKVIGRFFRISGHSIWSAIVEFSKLIQADMIVMGSAVMSPDFSRDLKNIEVNPDVSSVTKDVLMHTLLPVTVVRQPVELAVISARCSGESHDHL
ncbi:uncharacterized protein LOC131938254 isoform X2 [Physella acuta]|uniref:uncharacterized protein LOC131938254 isoform X2 n=1 Tax=Physella acuta TaxID=109671 RepID=UPI0027DD678B|nr:uncharacterized protein LOC131938254 isoform X2 [Physella acuta]